jgi:hypothetical protein
MIPQLLPNYYPISVCLIMATTYLNQTSYLVILKNVVSISRTLKGIVDAFVVNVIFNFTSLRHTEKWKQDLIFCMGVWQGVATDSLKYR